MTLYLDEDVDPLLAKVLRDRGFDCVSTKEANNRAASDAAQLRFATEQGRVILTFNVGDFVTLAHEWSKTGQPHAGIIVSDHLPFRELLRRILLLLQRHGQHDLTNTVLWLQDYKTPVTG
ncbi:DUF5615 family PIN-like protein [Nitrospira sp. BLG_2]|uniref:DUF5615 family PIN-like protein n=1 Tax=Nitrospira sp. BLG_2 TaxID=3397507 RepID=UPI003B99D5F8